MLRQNNIIIIENEALMSRSIEEALKTKSNFTYSLQRTQDYKAAFGIIKTISQLDAVFLNIDLFSQAIQRYDGIQELVSIIRKKFKDVRLFMLTSHCDNYLLQDIIKTLNPDSVLLKSDIDFGDLVKAIDMVMDDTPFYSKTILRLIRSQFVSGIHLDETDRLILYYLSKGTKTKDLTNVIYLTMSGIERRKRNLRTIFEANNDLALIEQARKRRVI